MGKNSQFVDYVVDLLSPLGPVVARRMFGADGVFIGEVMFAIVEGETLYLKTDADTRQAYESRGLGAFGYRRAGRDVHLSYHEAPAEALDDSETLLPWAERAYQTALRERRKKSR